jgi:hypothetical protein
MNVLADKHHAGLYRSLQLLAGRMGWTLYTPHGHAWWDEWYWSFGRSTYNDDRLARQFLMGPQEPDPEFPDVPIRYVSLEEAKRMPWAFVIASAQDNQMGFAKFAREVGAQFVVQAGNTGQYIDWSREPLVLNSSEMPLLGRGVVYHQEMEPVRFHPPRQWPSGSRVMASFVNCMPSMGRCYDLLQEYSRLDGQPVIVYGIDGPAGVVKPYERMVQNMADADFGWHDKAQGDGFGHVIHSWAAVGRPLIGHASHYRGKMAEPFWRDLETCIDLDRHSIPETVEIVRSMTPEQHREMCRAIREVFDRVDYAAEARSIADLLGAGVPA